MFCKECGKQSISEKAIVCVNCGSPMGDTIALVKETPWSSTKMFWMIILSLCFPLAGWIFGGFALTNEVTKSQGVKCIITATIAFVIGIMIIG